MKRDAALKLLHKDWSLAVRTPASREELLAWIGVYPLDPARSGTEVTLKLFNAFPPTDTGPIYRVRRFEVDEQLIQAEVWIADEDVYLKDDLIVFGDDNLFSRLAEFGVGPDDLELPATVDYPL
jgi:hypothetical protein